MFKNYVKQPTLSQNDYLIIMKTAPEGQKYCNAWCAKFLPEDMFYDNKANCKICYNVIVRARKMIDTNQITFEQFKENPSLIDREETIIPIYKKCITCEQDLSLDKFEANRKECLLCRRAKKKKDYIEDFNKYLPGIEAAKDDIPTLSNLLKGISGQVLKLVVKHYSISMPHEDRVKDKMFVKIVDHFKALLNPFICLGTCGHTLEKQFSVCDVCKLQPKNSAEEKMIEFEKNLDTIVDELTQMKTEDGVKFNKKQLQMIAKKLNIKFYTTWDKPVVMRHIDDYFTKRKEDEEKAVAEALKDFTGEINLNGIQILSRDDGYINATALCKAGGKNYSDWIRNKGVEELVSVLGKSLENSKDQLINSITTGKNHQRGTWIHPDLAVQLAQWISPTFALQISRWVREIAVTGSVTVGKEKSNVELLQLHDDLKKLQIQHRKLLEKKHYYKFKKGSTFYIISDLDGKSIKCKPGFEGVDIDVRLAQHRSTMPACKLNFLIYSNDADLVEKAVLKRFESKKRFLNHEWIYDVDIDTIIKSTRTILDILCISYTEEMNTQEYNNQIDIDFSVNDS